MDLLRRLSRNPETAQVLSSANNFRRFSQNAMTGVDTLTGIGLARSFDDEPGPATRRSTIGPVRRRSTRTEIGKAPSDALIGGGGPRRSMVGPRRSQIGLNGSSMEIVASIESAGKNLQRARRQSVKRQSVQLGDKAHYVSTHCNYRTEITALKMASEKESCSCLRGLLAHLNIYV